MCDSWVSSCLHREGRVRSRQVVIVSHPHSHRVPSVSVWLSVPMDDKTLTFDIKLTPVPVPIVNVRKRPDPSTRTNSNHAHLCFCDSSGRKRKKVITENRSNASTLYGEYIWNQAPRQNGELGPSFQMLSSMGWWPISWCIQGGYISVYVKGSFYIIIIRKK